MEAAVSLMPNRPTESSWCASLSKMKEEVGNSDPPLLSVPLWVSRSQVVEYDGLDLCARCPSSTSPLLQMRRHFLHNVTNPVSMRIRE